MPRFCGLTPAQDLSVCLTRPLTSCISTIDSTSVGNYVSCWDDEVSLRPHAQRLIFLDATDTLHLIEQHGFRRKANIYLVSFVHGMSLRVAGCCFNSRRFVCAATNSL